jgi:hypothetical protein
MCKLIFILLLACLCNVSLQIPIVKDESSDGTNNRPSLKKRGENQPSPKKESNVPPKPLRERKGYYDPKVGFTRLDRKPIKQKTKISRVLWYR